ncbi:MAG: RidA family protein [Acidimicrobiia bacterium]|jgi:enamine deaminase RidA (YjgF/YER057c/UK114 family)|nr:RidA family protein [Acidimicrobiia bacterium]MBA3983337.1 RidA family protein [Acidimicrobiia bacterium]
MNEIVVPAGIAPPAANYALGVVTTEATRWLHTAGVVATRPDGSVPPSIEEQARTVWNNVGAILEAAAMPIASVVNVTTYVVAGVHLAPVMAARDRFMDGHLAASTLVVVPALARPDWLVEISLVAAR